MSGVALFVVICFSFLNLHIQWDWVLNTPSVLSRELSQLAFWMVFFSIFYITIGLIKSILKAKQMPSVAVAIDLVGSLFSLIVVWILLKTTENSLLSLGYYHYLMLVMSPLLASYIFFFHFYPELRPSIKYYDRKSIKLIWSLGKKFLLIQICSVIIFSTDSLIIAQLLGPENVTGYVIVFKYFNILTVAFAMISMPFWSAYTDAYEKKEFEWIKRILLKQIYFLVPIFLVLVVMVLFGRFIIEDIWLGERLNIKWSLLVLMAVYAFLQAWNRVFNWVLNGIGELNVTLYSMLIGAVINIPVSILFVKYFDMGTSGVILGTIVSLSFYGVLGPIRATFLIKNLNSKH